MKKGKIYIEKMWVSGDTCIDTHDYFKDLAAKSTISKKRKEFIENLKKEDFDITFNKEDIDEDTICLIMDDTSVCEEEISLDEYKKLFDKKIRENAGENFHYPHSLRILDYFEDPFFPAVFKNEIENGGVDKFLIEDINQLEKLKSFYDKYHDNPKYKEALDCTILQQYIETPSKYASYLRVLAAGSGDVMGASLKYSSRTYSQSTLDGLFEKVFLNPNSKYFIDAKKMFNYYSGGQNIYFSQPSYSNEKVKILKEHNFDVNNLVLPDSILDVLKNIMEKCNREIGVMCGVDFMLNKNDNKWYYLENQAFPAIEEWAQAKRVSLPTSHTMKGYLELLEIELQARYEALMLTVEDREAKGLNYRI